MAQVLPDLSIVVPAYNEAGNVGPLYHATRDALQGLNLTCEWLFVNDGSSDTTEDEVDRLHQADPAVKLISLSRNFGHQNALSAGLRFARGRAVVTMDCDLQHPPELLPEMVGQWRAGSEVVYTVRRDTADATSFKRWTSRTFYRLINAVARTSIPEGAADYRLLDRKVVDTLNAMPENARFLRGMVGWVGFKQAALPYAAAPRRAGHSSYSLRRMVSFALTGITSFSGFPLRLSFYAGMVVALSAFAYAIYGIGIRLMTGLAVPGWTSLMVVVLLLGGVQMMMIGVLGEYLGRVFDQVKQRPPYVVRRTLGDFGREI